MPGTIIAMLRSPKHSPSGEKDMPQGFNTSEPRSITFPESTMYIALFKVMSFLMTKSPPMNKCISSALATCVTNNFVTYSILETAFWIRCDSSLTLMRSCVTRSSIVASSKYLTSYCMSGWIRTITASRLPFFAKALE